MEKGRMLVCFNTWNGEVLIADGVCQKELSAVGERNLGEWCKFSEPVDEHNKPRSLFMVWEGVRLKPYRKDEWRGVKSVWKGEWRALTATEMSRLPGLTMSSKAKDFFDHEMS